MFRIAVHLHLYYFEMWEIIKFYLNNLDQPYHLFVTMVSENEELKAKILQFHNDTTFFTVQNKGYDVGPFIYFLNKINLDDYDLILKLHTKNNKKSADTCLNGRWFCNDEWFRFLIFGLLGSKKIFNRNIKEFCTDKNLGMIGSRYLITDDHKVSEKLRDDICTEVAKLQYNAPKDIKFVAGTMFFIRSKLLIKIANQYTIDDFTLTDAKIKDGTLAHVMERVFGCVTCAEGYSIKGFDRDIKFEFTSKIKVISKFIYQKKITKNNYVIIKILKLPIYHHKQL